MLADEENEFGLQLGKLALKKSANEAVFRDIKVEAKLSDQDFSEENDKEKENNLKRFKLPLELITEKLRVKFKWMKDQWKNITDRVRVKSGKAPIQEPAWYKKLNSIFSDTNANMEVASKASASESDDSKGSDEENETDTCMNTAEEQSNLPDTEFKLEDAAASYSTASEQEPEQKSSKRGSTKPGSLSSSKRIRTHSQALQQIAKSFNLLHETQKDRAQMMREMMLDSERQRSEEFLKVQGEQAT